MRFLKPYKFRGINTAVKIFIQINMHFKNLSKFIFLAGILLSLSYVSFTQVPVLRTQNKIIVDGKVYYLHVVKAGQTLYSICLSYEVSEKEISKENPGADDALQIGQVLKIPVKTNTEIAAPLMPPPDTAFEHHTVKQGETMYSIAKSYDISTEELEKINPLVIDHEIKIGQWINIPRNKNEIAPEDVTYHKVKRRETIFGIAKKYNISEELLKKTNPELLIHVPKPGQILKIPPAEKVGAVQINQVMEKRDTIPVFESLKYDTLKIADNYSYYLDSLPGISNRAFNVAYLIPFNYRPVEEVVPVEEQRKTKDDIINLDHESNPNDQMLSSRNFLEFMEGSLLAIDSLRSEGISVNVFFFDTQKSPARTREILSSPDFQNTDLIIGPFFSYNVEIVSEYSRINRIPMVSPLSGEEGPVAKNPFFFQLNPGYKPEYDRIADYLSGFSDSNIVFILGTDSIEKIKYNYLKEDFLKRSSLVSPPDSQYIKEIVYDYTVDASLSEDILKTLSLEKNNIVVVPETDEAFVSTVVTQLYFQLKTYNISVVGMPHWNTFQNIDFLYYHKLSLSYFTPYYFSYDSANVRHFLKDYRNCFYSEPVTLTKKGGSYAFLGYDLSYNFLKIMNKYGRRFILHLNDTVGHELMNDFHFVPVGKNGGFENRSLVLVKFFENLEIRAEPYEIAVPDEIVLPSGLSTGEVPVE
jgi:LysM repeat protein